MTYQPAATRYDEMQYNRCGRSGLKLPQVSLGLWHNWGDQDNHETMRKLAHTAFDLGITHFDLANNYGPAPGAAEINFGKVLKQDLAAHRDELIISSKAGYDMWPGPYGEWGSRKYLLASLDQSLKRMDIDYVDIFYSHRFDPDTPLEETMMALDHAVRSGKALYVGISSYGPKETAEAARILRELGTPCLIHQPYYNMFDRWIEDGLTDVLDQEGMGSIVFSPLAQGLLTNKYLKGIPKDSRAAKDSVFLTEDSITPNKLAKISALNDVAQARGQNMAQFAIKWVLRLDQVTSALIGASKPEQIIDIVEGQKAADFSAEELARIDEILRMPD